jgi:hypothetical protein
VYVAGKPVVEYGEFVGVDLGDLVRRHERAARRLQSC